MRGLEDRLVDLGFMRTTTELPEEAPRRFHRTQHFVIFYPRQVPAATLVGRISQPGSGIVRLPNRFRQPVF